MGAVTFSLDHKLLEYLREVLPLDVLVETGTFRGDTVAIMAERMSEVHSVELSQDLFVQASQRFAAQDHIHLHHGESAEFLRGLRPRLAGRSVLFWLDAHWCRQGTAAGETSQCPLLEELVALGQLGDDSAVLIDDARLYLCPPPVPHESSQWPSLHEVLSALRALSDRHELMVVNDVMAFHPPSARTALQRYARAHGVDWLAVITDKRERDDLERQLKQVRTHVADSKQAAAAHESAMARQQQRCDSFRKVVAEDKQTIRQLRHSIDQLKQSNRKQAETIDGLRTNLDAARQKSEAQRERIGQQDEALARKQSDLERVRTDLGQKLETLREQLQDREVVTGFRSEVPPKDRDQTAIRTETVTT